MSPALPRSADIVIIGAGAIGASIAYQLGRRGARDVVVLERDTVGAGSTSKAAGGIRVQFATRVEIELSLRGIAFFKRFEDEMGVPCDFHQEGYLFVITDEPTLARFRDNVALQRSMGGDVRVIAPDDARALVPSLQRGRRHRRGLGAHGRPRLAQRRGAGLRRPGAGSAACASWRTRR